MTEIHVSPSSPCGYRLPQNHSASVGFWLLCPQSDDGGRVALSLSSVLFFVCVRVRAHVQAVELCVVLFYRGSIVQFESRYRAASSLVLFA